MFKNSELFDAQVSKEIKTQNKPEPSIEAPVPEPPKLKRKNNISDEGRLKLKENFKKMREVVALRKADEKSKQPIKPVEVKPDMGAILSDIKKELSELRQIKHNSNVSAPIEKVASPVKVEIKSDVKPLAPVVTPVKIVPPVITPVIPKPYIKISTIKKTLW